MASDDLKRFITALYDENEAIWWAYNYNQQPADMAAVSQAVAIDRLCNPQSGDLMEGAKIGLNPAMRAGSRRGQENCGTFRNLLVEFDSGGSAQDQMDLAKSVDLPFTTATWSGNRSVHFVVSLETPCSDWGEYRDLHKRLNATLKIKGSDQSVGNPVQHTRAPFGYRYNLSLSKNDFSCAKAFDKYKRYIESAHLGFTWIDLFKRGWFIWASDGETYESEVMARLKDQFTSSNGQDPIDVLYKSDEQRLLQVNTRVDNDQFLKWLASMERRYVVPELPSRQHRPYSDHDDTDATVLRWLDEMGVKYSNGLERTFQCPVCADGRTDKKKGNLKVKVCDSSDQDRKTVFHCYAGCSGGDVLKAMRRRFQEDE